MDIVIIENDIALLRSLEIHLNARGHNVRCFDSADAALQVLIDEPPQVLIVDLVMPGIDGLETLKRLTDLGHTPQLAILISGHTDLVDGLDIEQHGFHHFLSKPFDGATLIQVLEGTEPPPLKKGHSSEI